DQDDVEILVRRFENGCEPEPERTAIPTRALEARRDRAQVRQHAHDRHDLHDQPDGHRDGHRREQFDGAELPVTEQRRDQDQDDGNPPEELAIAFAHQNADQGSRDLAAEHEPGIDGGERRDREDQQPPFAANGCHRGDRGDRDQHPDRRVLQARQQHTLGELGLAAHLIFIEEANQQQLLADQSRDRGDLGDREQGCEVPERVGCHRPRGQREQGEREPAAADLEQDGPGNAARDIAP
ncbi:hypothetical protein chiPu_0030714, partial [Chiloscyllium punctatum]|nr:hypothetical protein [Chiloscyllium punctatum]